MRKTFAGRMKPVHGPHMACVPVFGPHWCNICLLWASMQ